MHLFAEITKFDAEKRIVMGYASTEAMDSQGEIVTKAAMEAALPGFMKFGNIREMHKSDSAVGVVMKDGATIDEKGIYLEAKVVDDQAWEKVKAGVYKGFSIGGRATARDPMKKSIITGLDLTEISLVDRPANPEAIIELFKVDAGNTEDIAKKDEAEEKEPSAVNPQTAVEPGDGQAAAFPAGAPDAGSNSEENRELAGEGKAPVPVEPLSEPVKKSMYGVSNLADILSMINCAQQDAQWEADMEMDGSSMPAKLKAWLADGASLLTEMVAEETSEMNNKADQGGDISKMAVTDLSQMITDAVAKAIGAKDAQIDTLEKRVKELESQPVPMKGPVNANIVAKADDSLVIPEEPEKEPETVHEAMLKAHSRPTFTKL